MKTNTRRHGVTHEGGRALAHQDPLSELRRSVLCCLLWEKQFYEDGVDIADRIASLVPKCDPDLVASLADEARNAQGLRHVPLYLCKLLAEAGTLKAATLEKVIRRADEPGEFLAMWWAAARRPVPAAVKRGLAAALTRFDAYQLAKYERKGAEVKIRDVIRLVHPKPRNDEQAEAFRACVRGELSPPDTWEVALSTTTDKRAAWHRLLVERKLGTLALIRNLRNMEQAGVDRADVRSALNDAKPGRTLPFRFVAAARNAPWAEPELQTLMLSALGDAPKLAGQTTLLVDRSVSMKASLSSRSEMTRYDAACALAILLREVCEDVRVFTYTTRDGHWGGDMSCDLREVAPRRGFALRDAMGQPFGGTPTGAAIAMCDNGSRLIVLTDEQSHDPIPAPRGKGYMVNVASYKPSIAFGPWKSITGWSERVVDFIAALESGPAPM